MYGKVGGAIVVGESGGARAAIKSIVYDPSIAGLTIPPDAEVYRANDAGFDDHNRKPIGTPTIQSTSRSDAWRATWPISPGC